MMKDKLQSSKSATKFVVTNIVIAVVIAVVLFVIVVLWLNKYTLHGKEITIPQVTGMTQ